MLLRQITAGVNEKALTKSDFNLGAEADKLHSRGVRVLVCLAGLLTFLVSARETGVGLINPR